MNAERWAALERILARHSPDNADQWCSRCNIGLQCADREDALTALGMERNLVFDVVDKDGNWIRSIWVKGHIISPTSWMIGEPISTRWFADGEMLKMFPEREEARPVDSPRDGTAIR